MNHDQYPALYRAADEASKWAQNNLLRDYVFGSVLLILGASLAACNLKSPIAMVCNAFLFIGSLAAYAHSQYRDYRGKWYKTRALAESVKTATWRLVMGADPFASSNPQANLDKFNKLLKELLLENKEIGALIGGRYSNQEQITPEMVRISSLSVGEKRVIYLQDRIKEQGDWYAGKAETCKKDNSRFFRYIFVTYAVAIAFVLLKIAFPEYGFLHVELLAVIVSSFISWVQLRRFDELASAYGLTAHEVGLIMSQMPSATDAKKFSGFVSDAENAFSREHTQWAARRDH